jgi:hypothetical protein
MWWVFLEMSRQMSQKQDCILEFLGSWYGESTPQMRRKVKNFLERAERLKGKKLDEWTKSDYKSFQDKIENDEVLGKNAKTLLRLSTQRFFRWYHSEWFALVPPKNCSPIMREKASSSEACRMEPVGVDLEKADVRPKDDTGTSSPPAIVVPTPPPPRPLPQDWSEALKIIGSQSNRHMRQIGYETSEGNADPFGRSWNW